MTELNGAIAIVTLNRPERRNALSLELMRELISELARIENKRRLVDSKDTKKPSLRRASTGNDPNSTSTTSSTDPNSTNSDDGPPTLHRRDDQN